MVLQHVAQRAVFVVIAQAVADTDGFGDRNLHVIDRTRGPQRLENGVAEAQRQQVLHRFLTEIVVDAEGARFVEGVADGVVDDLGRRQVTADRLFDDDAVRRMAEAGGAQLFANRLEQGRRNRQEIDDVELVDIAELFFQLLAPVGVGGVERDVGQGLDQAVGGAVFKVLADTCLQRIDHPAAELFGLHLFPRHRNETQIVGQEPVLGQHGQRRPEHAHGQIAGATDENEDRTARRRFTRSRRHLFQHFLDLGPCPS